MLMYDSYTSTYFNEYVTSHDTSSLDLVFVRKVQFICLNLWEVQTSSKTVGTLSEKYDGNNMTTLNF